MKKNGAYPNLFSSIKLGNREIRNRVALIATLTNFGRDNTVTDRWISFLVIDTLGPLLEARVNINRVGDCQSPRNLMTAIHNGHLVGLNL